MTAPKLVVFDCDGTLVDSQHAIAAGMAAAWQACGLGAPPPVSVVRRVVGLPLAEAIARLHPSGSDAEHHRLTEAYKEAFRALPRHREEDEPLFPGVVTCLDALEARGFLLGIATGKGRRGLSITLDRHGITNRFVTVTTADDAPGKPRPDMLHKAMADVGARPQDVVMVGDTIFDMIMATSANVAAVGAGWGYHDRAQLLDAGARMVLESFDELLPALPEIMWWSE
jgi:phosphoglycolate phosphatase